jgi:myo-inositol-1(or 4)-monophosphatase
MHESVEQRVATGLAAVRGQIAFFHEHFGRAESEWKHDGTRVTHADHAISRALCDEILSAFPGDEFFSEETEAGTRAVPMRARFAWIVDPIDGTNNYALGIPVCAISLALLEDGVPVYGFVYDCGLRTLFHGGPGRGLFADEAPIARAVSDSRHEKVVAVHTPISATHHALVARLISGYKLRAYGSGALHLTYVSLGRLDAALDLTVRVWDIAAAYAFCAVTGVGVRFLDAEVFPMREFDVHMKPVRYLAGPSEILDRLEAAVRETGAGAGNG